MNMRLYLFLLLSMVALAACDFESDTPILSPDKEYKLYDFYEDEYGNRGVVAYVLEDSYTVVISCDETEAAWGPMGEQVYNGDTISDNIINMKSFGLAMLQSMKARGIEKYPAQAWCDHKNAPNSYPNVSSWRLPSHSEMSMFFHTDIQLNRLNNYIARYGGDIIQKDEMYWTCVEDFDGYLTINNQTSDYDKENRAIVRTPLNKVYSNKDRWIKKNIYRVRAIKYIYYQ